MQIRNNRTESPSKEKSFTLLGDFVYSIHFFFHKEPLDKTYVYEYNDIGNLTLVKEYDYYAPDEELPRCQKCAKYEYDADCPDKLTKFGGNKIEYNSIGYPTKYKGKDYEWANGKLSKIHRSTVIQDEEHYTTRTFTYDGYGRRTQKHSVFGVNYFGADAVNSYSHSHTNDYTYDNNGRLIREVYTRRDSSGTVSETRELVYLYDESGMIGVMYNSQPYYYHRNLQGDVIAIYDANGEKQVEYAYDAWGNCEVICADTQGLAYANPIRYRGYYYDEDTKLYYLNARYYSPEWRRFISPDATEYIDPETPNGLNLYAYCGNDPVNRFDPLGHIAISTLIWIIVGAAALTTAGTITYGAVTETPVVIDFSVSGGMGAGVGGKAGLSIVLDFKNDSFGFYPHYGYYYGAKANTFGFSYGIGLISNYENEGDYAGPFVDFGGGFYGGIDHCYDPRHPHDSTVKANSITFGNNKGVYYGYDYYDYWGSASFSEVLSFFIGGAVFYETYI